MCESTCDTLTSSAANQGDNTVIYMVIVIRNGPGNPSSNSGPGCVFYVVLLNILWKDMNPTILPLVMIKE